VKRIAIALIVTSVTMLLLDLAWLGIVAKPFYDRTLGALRRPEVHWQSALVFYAMYVSFVVGVAVLPTQSIGEAAWRGAAMGFFAYATYELTNMAVIQGWPWVLVPADVVWGVVLTATVAACGRFAIA
jgi:uncharacterized membrane protein